MGLKLRSTIAPYEKEGVIYSAYQRKEIVEVDTETNVARVVGHWEDHDEALKKVKQFNRKQRENSRRR